MKKMTILSQAALICVFASGFAVAAEPTEAEMLSALKWRLDQAGQQADSMSEDCKYLREGNNPFVALNCMFGSIQKEAQRSISITGFEKVGCGKARATGYVCDYRIKLAGSMLPNTWSPIQRSAFYKIGGSG